MKLKIFGNNGPFPGPLGACSGYMVSTDDGNTNIALDMGTGTLAKLLSDTPIEHVTAVILSHLHLDHMSDILPLQYVLQFSSRKNLPVYAPTQPENVAALLHCPRFDLREHASFETGGIQVDFMAALHPVPGSAVSFSDGKRRIVYTGDTNWFDALAPFCENADILLADAGLPDAKWSEKAPHLSAKKCGELAKAANAKKLLLTHLNPNFDEDALLAEAASVFPNCALARIGDAYPA